MVGIPGPYGENWFYLKAVLQRLGMSEQDITISNIGYTQVAALQTGQVGAVVGFVNNDVIRLQRAGFEVSLFNFGSGPGTSDSLLPLVGASVGTSDLLVEHDSERMHQFMKALRLAMEFCVEHPQETVDIAAEYVPGLNEQSNRDAALATLEATVALYGSGPAQYGTLDEVTWEAMASFMPDAGLVTAGIPAREAYTTTFAGPRPK
jgi:NitT/TauT family transport system substrate-binding protein